MGMYDAAFVHAIVNTEVDMLLRYVEMYHKLSANSAFAFRCTYTDYHPYSSRSPEQDKFEIGRAHV